MASRGGILQFFTVTLRKRTAEPDPGAPASLFTSAYYSSSPMRNKAEMRTLHRIQSLAICCASPHRDGYRAPVLNGPIKDSGTVKLRRYLTFYRYWRHLKKIFPMYYWYINIILQFQFRQLCFYAIRLQNVSMMYFRSFQSRDLSLPSVCEGAGQFVKVS